MPLAAARRSLAGLAVVVLAGCAGTGATGPVDASAGAPLDAAGHTLARGAVVERMRAARYVLLGEVHDNAAQHRLRAGLLRELLADARPTWVVFEQMDRQHNAAVVAAAREVNAIVAAGQLNQQAWGWPLHRPLFEAALAGGAAIRGGNLGRADVSPVVRQGEAGLPPDLRHWFDGSVPAATWGPAQAELMLRLVDEGHCKALPAAMMAPMVLAQRARDAALADTLLQAPPGVRVVLIAGNGHVRRDLGVPRYLAAAGVAEDDMLSIGFEELDAGVAALADPRYDLAWTSAVAQRSDPCASLRTPAKPGPA